MYQVIQDPKIPQPTLEQCSGLSIGDELWKLVEDCWDKDSVKRPDAQSLLKRLEGMDGFEKNAYCNLPQRGVRGCMV
jgi:hypothetical protein